MRQQINYDHSCCEGYHTLSITDLIKVGSIIQKIAKELWQRKSTKAIDLNHDLMNEEFDKLWQGASEAKVSKQYSETRIDTLRKLRTNLVTFVAFKNYNQRLDMIKALTDEKGNIRSFNNFKKAVDDISQDYNKNWLRAEYNTTIASSQTAVQWSVFQKQKNVYPYLTYRTQGDSLVRNDHRQYDKVTKHIDDPFWNTRYPPNDWNCRCYVLQSKTKGNNAEAEFSDEKQPELFKHNAGKDEKIFTKHHPYFDVKKDEREKIIQARNEYFKNPLFYETKDDVKIHVSQLLGNNNIEHELSVGKNLSSFFGEKITMPSLLEDSGIAIPDFITETKVIEYKNVKSDKLSSIENNVSGAINQINKSLYNNLEKYILVRVAKNADLKRIKAKIFNGQRKGFKLLFIQGDEIKMA